MDETTQEPRTRAPSEPTGAAPDSGGRPTLSVAPTRINPSDFSISLAAKGGAEALLTADQGAAVQELPGFDETYIDIVDYIVRITHRIWEEKDIGYIYDTYRHNARVTDDVGMQIGRDKIVADTIHTINAFPDIRLFADEVIWATDSAGAFHTSHRVSKIAHNVGHSRWGPPTGRKVVLWVIANCVSRENEIFEEWVLYNTGSLLAQLGFDLRVLARQLAAEDPAPALDDPPSGELERLRGQGAPRHLTASQADGFDVEDFVRRTYHYTWNWRNLSTIDRAYAARVSYHGGTGRELYGRGQLKSFVLSLMAMFPDLVMHVDDIYWMGNDVDGYSVAVRWTAIGTHRGHGIYGPPSGRQAKIWGLSQHHIIGGQIIEEWTVFNEFELLKQLLRDGLVATC